MKDISAALIFVAICAALAATAHYMRRCIEKLEQMTKLVRHMLKGMVRVFTRT